MVPEVHIFVVNSDSVASDAAFLLCALLLPFGVGLAFVYALRPEWLRRSKQELTSRHPGRANVGRLLVATLLTALCSALYIHVLIGAEPVRLVVTDSFLELEYRLPSQNVRVPLHEIEEASAKLVSRRRRGGTYDHAVLSLVLKDGSVVRVRSGGAPRFERALEQASEAIRQALDH